MSARPPRFTRFERKIVGPIVTVALVPVIVALVLGRLALREVYGVGVNERVEASLDGGLDAYRAWIVALRLDAERTADAVARGPALRAALDRGERDAASTALRSDLVRYPELLDVRVEDAAGALLASAAHGVPDERRTRVVRRDLGGGRSLVLVASTSEEPFARYAEAGETADLYGRLRQGTDEVTSFYLYVFLAFLGFTVLVTTIVALTLARRITRRIARLAEATKRVGTGDLTVRVETVSGDEIGALTAAFNDMVRDLRESRERIEDLQRIGAWQEFARRLAHEIKNPLTPIQLAVQEVDERYHGEDARYARTVKDARAIVEEEVATLRRLVGEFSAFAKLPEARLEPAELGEFLRDAARALEAIPEQDGVRVHVDAPRLPVPVRIDPMMLKRCLDNLVRNAAQALRERGGGDVWVTATREGQSALLEVRDDGPGVPEEDRLRVFEPYFTTKSDGTGLGLAIVKKVVLEHGGRISCERAPEGGAAFRVRLPVVGIGE